MGQPLEFSEMRMRQGDDPAWASSALDDSDWRVVTRNSLPLVRAHEGIRWLRFRVRWNSAEGRIPSQLHVLSFRGAYDVYWDGVHASSNGSPSETAAGEIEGESIDHINLSPAQTAPGQHLVAIRFSTWSATGYNPATYFAFFAMSQTGYEASFLRDNVLPMIAAGVLLTLALASFVMWLLAARRRVLLLLAGFCLSGCVMQGVYWFAIAYPYPVSERFAFDVIKTSAGLVMSLCLVSIVIDEWRIRRGYRWLALLVPIDVFIAIEKFPSIATYAERFIGVSFAFVVCVGVWTAFRQKRNTWVIVAPAALSGFLLWRDFYHYVGADFFQCFMPTVLGLVVAIALRLRRERKQTEEIKLTAARLETELLKKNLQPHFLMNTLTALAQTVEESPGNAVQLIDDLAEEFRTLSRMAGEKSIPLDEELDLCRAHLRVMRARTDIPWRLESDGVDGHATVPPALFLTLIENGFSHQRPLRGHNVFTLHSTANGHGAHYTFRSPGAVTTETSRAGGGTGLRYIRARLEESFPGAWSLSQGEIDGAWQTDIEIGLDHPSGSPA